MFTAHPRYILLFISQQQIQKADSLYYLGTA